MKRASVFADALSLRGIGLAEILRCAQNDDYCRLLLQLLQRTHVQQKLGVVSGLAQLVDQQLHGFDR
jgi:hypothetical protein